ncbi:MAG TPA: peptidoglycan DD-metalloendopeptidase family protein [Dehalococcoidia bacterium]|nr:peptidoglycan DD-metalloendopeptidase family protein [Dehalococcoidia bacterium]
MPFAQGQSARIIQGCNGGTHTRVDPYAIDLVLASGATSGATVVAPFSGTVTWTSGGPRVGNGCMTIAVDGGGYSTMLCHVIFDRAFGRNERVGQGQRIGYVGPAGTVGNNGTPHVHMELYAGRRVSVPFASGSGLPLEGVELPSRGRYNDWAGTIIPSGGSSAVADTRTTAAGPSARGATAAGAASRSGPVIVRGSEGCLNVRSTPGLRGRVLGCLPEGTRVTIVAGPTSADGLSWYSLQGRGWAAGAYLQAAGG